MALHYHKGKGKDKALALLSELSGKGHCVVQGDIAKPAEITALFKKLDEKVDVLDILVNNVGIYKYHSITTNTFEEWQEIWLETISTNLTGPANMIYHAVSRMVKNGGGRIINISSRGAFRGEPDAPAYGASKAGLNALGQSMAVALASKGIQVYTIAPGFVNTDMAAPILTAAGGKTIADRVR